LTAQAGELGDDFFGEGSRMGLINRKPGIRDAIARDWELEVIENEEGEQ
jgi:hypothetical protein